MHFRGCSGGLCTCCFNVFPEALTANSHILIHAVVWDRLLSISEEGGVIHRTGFSLPTVTLNLGILALFGVLIIICLTPLDGYRLYTLARSVVSLLLFGKCASIVT